MTEETKIETVELTPVEVQAIAKGWKPKEEFDSDPKNEGKSWRSAEDFMDRQSFFDKIDEQRREIKTLAQGLKAQSEYNARIEKLSYDKAIKDLKAQRKMAREDGDYDTVDEIDEQIEQVKEQKARVVQPPPVAQETPPAVQEWVKANPWYNTDADMREFADFTANQLAQRGISGDELLEKVSEKVKTTYAMRFRNPNKEKAPVMEKGTSAAKKTDADTLTPEEEHLIRHMVKAGIPRPDGKGNMTADEYRAQMKKAKGA